MNAEEIKQSIKNLEKASELAAKLDMVCQGYDYATIGSAASMMLFNMGYEACAETVALVQSSAAQPIELDDTELEGLENLTPGHKKYTVN